MPDISHSRCSGARFFPVEGSEDFAIGADGSRSGP